MISVAEYRKILNDYTSSEDLIVQRLQYLEALMRNIIRVELHTHVTKSKKQN